MDQLAEVSMFHINTRVIKTPTVDCWQKPELIDRELTTNKKPVDYKTIIDGNRVLFLGETHENYPIRDHIATHAQDLRDSGITHYAIEALSSGADTFAKLARDPETDLSAVDVGPNPYEGARESYIGTIRAMARTGILVIPIDIQHEDPEVREQHLTDRVEAILRNNPNAKVAVLIGTMHTNRVVGTSDVPHGSLPHLGYRISQQFSTVNVQFIGGTEKYNTLTKSSRSLGLVKEEFMLDMRPYRETKNAPFSDGPADYVIHLPYKGEPPVKPPWYEFMEQLENGKS